MTHDEHRAIIARHRLMTDAEYDSAAAIAEREMLRQWRRENMRRSIAQINAACDALTKPN